MSKITRYIYFGKFGYLIQYPYGNTCILKKLIPRFICTQHIIKI